MRSSPRTDGLLAFAYAKTGKTAQAQEIARGLEGLAGRQVGADGAAARAYLGLGETTRALGLLERAAAAHDPLFTSESLAESFFDQIRGSARFAAIVSNVGLDPRLAAKQ
jgi:hypothetical protein